MAFNLTDLLNKNSMPSEVLKDATEITGAGNGFSSNITNVENVKVLDISLLDIETKQFLKEKERNIESVFHKARFDVGRELREAQEQLSQNGYGCFGEWCESIGFNREMSSRLMNYHDLIVRNSDKRDFIESLPKTLAYETARPSIPLELREAVLNGEITTNKELQEAITAQKEAERRAKEAEEILASELEKSKKLEETISTIEEDNATLRNRPVEIAVQETIKEVIPDDYEFLKEQNQLLANQVEELNRIKDTDHNVSTQKTISAANKIKDMLEKRLSMAQYDRKSEKEAKTETTEYIRLVKLLVEKVDKEVVKVTGTI